MNVKVEVEAGGFASSHTDAKEVEDCIADEPEDCTALEKTARIGSVVAVARSWSWSIELASKHMGLLGHSCCLDSTLDV